MLRPHTADPSRRPARGSSFLVRFPIAAPISRGFCHPRCTRTGLVYAPRRRAGACDCARQRRHSTGQVAKRGHRLAPPLAGARSSLPSAYSIRRSFSSLRLRAAECAVCASAPASPKVRAPPRNPSSLYPRADRPRSFRPGPSRKKRHRGRAREPRKRTRKGTICLK